MASETWTVPAEVCVELEDREATPDRTVGSEKEG